MDNNILDFGEILSRPIVNSNPQPSFSLDESQPITESAEFEPEPEPAPQPTRVSTEEYQQGFEAGEFVDPDSLAVTVVNLLDGLQSAALPYFRERKVFTKHELEIIDGLDTSGGTVYPENSPEKLLLAKWLKHNKICEKIPFNDGEKTRLTSATAKYVGTTQMKVTPFQNLLISLGEVVTVRAAYFMVD